MNKIFIYSSIDGQTLKICQRLHSKFNNSHIRNLDDVRDDELKNFDQIIIGAGVRYGDHSKKIYDFIKKNKDILVIKKTAFFSVNATARKEDKNNPLTNPYIKKFLKKTNWKPNKINVFAGKINFPKYSFLDKYMIKLIMWITNGPTDTSKSHEFTNWEKVDEFSKEIENN